MLKKLIAVFVGGAFFGYVAGMIPFAVVMLLILLVAEIKYPNTDQFTRRPNVFGMHYITKRGKEKEARAKDQFIQSFFNPLFKLFSILGVIAGIVFFYQEIM